HLGTPPLAGAPATISIGTNPTFAADGAPRRTVEAYVHDDHDLDLYGDLVRLEFVDFQRPTLKFDSVEPLIEQMDDDVEVTRRTLALDPSRREVTGWHPARAVTSAAGSVSAPTVVPASGPVRRRARSSQSPDIRSGAPRNDPGEPWPSTPLRSSRSSRSTGPPRATPVRPRSRSRSSRIGSTT